MRLVPNSVEGFNHFSQRSNLMVKNNKNFFFGKINPASNDAFVDLMYIFQQPQTTAAMDLWEIKCYMALVLIGEMDELFLNICILKESVFFLPGNLVLG